MTSIKTPGEWRHQHTSLVSSTDTCLRTSARVRDEATWLNDHTRVQTSRDQEDVRFRLKEKLKSTARWREELQEELALNKKQTESLRRCLAKLKKALAKSDEPLKVSTECQHYRESRIGIDKVEDEVELGLVKEVDCIREYQQRMKLLIELIIKQLDSNLSAQKQLNTDIRNKKISVRIDGICEKLNNESGELESHSRIQNILVNKSVPESWNRDSQNNVQVSRNSRWDEAFSSQQLERDASNMIRRAENAMKTNWNDVNNAFRERITETLGAQLKVTDQLKHVDREAALLRKELRRLKAGHHDKLAPVKLTQTRLERRSHRPDTEACTDPPHLRLLKESQQLEDSKDLLNKKIKESENALKLLDEDKAALERDIKVKKVTLNIDKNKCLPLRAIFKFDMNTKVTKK